MGFHERSTVRLPHLWILHLWTQPSADGKYLEKNCVVAQHLQTFLIIILYTIGCKNCLHSVRYYRVSRCFVSYMGEYVVVVIVRLLTLSTSFPNSTSTGQRKQSTVVSTHAVNCTRKGILVLGHLNLLYK
jgi:hypothetical protein